MVRTVRAITHPVNIIESVMSQLRLFLLDLILNLRPTETSYTHTRTHTRAIIHTPPEQLHEEILTTFLLHRFMAIFFNPQTIGKHAPCIS